jgi:hypothetical protein
MFTKSAVCDLLLFICIISSTSAFFLQPNGLRNKPIPSSSRHKSTSIFSEPPTKSTIKSLITREFLTHRSPDSERREAVAAHLKSSSSYPGYANLFTSALADLGSEMQAEARLEYESSEEGEEGGGGDGGAWGKDGEKAWKLWAVVDLTVQARVFAKEAGEEG